MAREIENYQDLQDAVRDWLNRSDATVLSRIPTFIYLAERKMFRRYRAPNNEKTILIQMRTTPNPPDEVVVSDRFDIPGDYLESLTLQMNGQTMVRKSLTEIQGRIDAASGPQFSGAVLGEPKFFARERGAILVWPFPVGNQDVKWIYYCDLSGNLELPDDDNDVLRTAPDLYLYGSLLQAQPFLKPTDDEWQLIPTWKSLYDDAFALIEFQRDEDERSGSNVTINSAFGGQAPIRARGGNS